MTQVTTVRRSRLRWACGQVVQASEDRFYGKIIVVMEAGVVKRIIKEESIEPPEK